MNKLIAVALLAVPLTFAAQAPAGNTTDQHAEKTAKVKKHSKKAKHAKGADAATSATPAAPTTK